MNQTATTPISAARRLVTPPVADLFAAEIANENHGGASPATLSSTIDSIAQGLPFPDGVDADQVLTALLVIRDLLPGHTCVEDLL